MTHPVGLVILHRRSRDSPTSFSCPALRWAQVDLSELAPHIVANGCLAALLNVSVFVVIKETGAVTYGVAGQVHLQLMRVQGVQSREGSEAQTHSTLKHGRIGAHLNPTPLRVIIARASPGEGLAKYPHRDPDLWRRGDATPARGLRLRR